LYRISTERHEFGLAPHDNIVGYSNGIITGRMVELSHDVALSCVKLERPNKQKHFFS
jgi:hypothetical protein